MEVSSGGRSGIWDCRDVGLQLDAQARLRTSEREIDLREDKDRIGSDQGARGAGAAAEAESCRRGPGPQDRRRVSQDRVPARGNERRGLKKKEWWSVAHVLHEEEKLLVSRVCRRCGSNGSMGSDPIEARLFPLFVQPATGEFYARQSYQHFPAMGLDPFWHCNVCGGLEKNFFF